MTSMNMLCTQHIYTQETCLKQAEKAKEAKSTWSSVLVRRCTQGCPDESKISLCKQAVMLSRMKHKKKIYHPPP